MPEPRVELDPRRRVVTLGDWTADLTDLEVAALQYLLDRAGEVVTRQSLERDVWEMAPGVQSDAVSVALRRLRAKLGPHGDVLVTLRGRGWMLRSPDRPEALPVVGPRFGTPFQPREDEETGILDLVAAGWRVVTVVGPGGVGKTRLVGHIAGRLGDDVSWIPLGGARTDEDVLRAVLSGFGTEATDTAGLEVALAARPDAWIVLDEAEWALDPVRDLLATLQGGRFLVTSRQEIGVPSEAVLELRGLESDAARHFLRSRLAAARWGNEADDATVERAVRLLGGHPLSLELVAAHPDDLATVLGDLERGDLPVGPEMDQLQATVRRSWDRLDGPEREALQAISLCEAPLTDAELLDWLGTEARGSVRELAWRSLLSREGRAWTVLRATRLFALEEDGPGDRTAQRASLDRWLVARAHTLRERLYREPRVTHADLSRLADALLEVVARAPEPLVRPLVRDLVELFGLCGPATTHNAVADAAMRRFPHDLELRLVAARVYCREIVPGDLDRGTESADPDVRVAAEMARRAVLPVSTRPDRLAAVQQACADPILAHRLQAERVTVEGGLGHEDAVPLGEALLAGAAGAPLLEWLAHIALGRACASLGRAADGIAHLDAALAIARDAGVGQLVLVTRHVRGVGLLKTDLDAALAEYRALAEAWARVGHPVRSAQARGMAGLHDYARGRVAEARDDLAWAALHEGRGVGVSCRWLLDLADVRLGQRPASDVPAIRARAAALPDARWLDGDGLWPMFDVEEALAGEPERARLEALLETVRRIPPQPEVFGSLVAADLERRLVAALG